jgi:hypothetical protein
VNVELPKVPNREHKARLSARCGEGEQRVVLWFTYIDTCVRIRRENGTRPKSHLDISAHYEYKTPTTAIIPGIMGVNDLK